MNSTRAHPFYQAWSAGELSLGDLRHYSQQYFAHVRAFSAYLSEMHCRCVDLKCRQIIAANLADEEAVKPTHPELWLDFAEGIGASRETVFNADIGLKMKALVRAFRSVAQLETGLAGIGLYCYEKQIPAVASAKIAGLSEKYGISTPSTIRYFTVHEKVDVEHAAQWEALLADNPVSDKQAAETADIALDALWAALDEIHVSSSCASSN